MTVKQIEFNEVAQERLLKGARVLVKAVGVTCGPRGRQVVIEGAGGKGHSTRDGITVAESIDLKDTVENAGAALMRDAARRTAEQAGDGTSTTVVLAEAMLSEAIKATWSGSDPGAVRRGLLRATTAMGRELTRLAKPCQDETAVARVATIAANGDAELGALVASALHKAGMDGAVVIQEGARLGDELEVIEGMRFEGGCVDEHFLGGENRVDLETPYVLLADETISNAETLLPLLKTVSEFSRPLLIVADVQGHALATLVANHHRGTVKLAVVRPPAAGEQRRQVLEDMAALTGGQVAAPDTGTPVEKAGLNMLGSTRTAQVTLKHTTLVGGSGYRRGSGPGWQRGVDARISRLRREIDDAGTEAEADRLRRRLADLCASVSVIRLGAASELEMAERKARAGDALAAARAALAEGVLPGGGVALLRARQAVGDLPDDDPDEAAGIRAALRAAEAPLCRIVENAGGEPQVVVNRIAGHDNPDFGFNAATGKFGDMPEMEILDPARVVRCALENAASVAGLLITSESVIAEAPADSETPEERETAGL